jgi:hypothetical protein
VKVSEAPSPVIAGQFGNRAGATESRHPIGSQQTLTTPFHFDIR